jgi:hypothetical protein
VSDRQEVERALPGARASGTGWWRVNCPLCVARTGKPDRKGALAVNVRHGVYQCWKCQAHGRISPGQGVPDDDVALPDEVMEPPEGFVALAGDDSMALGPARAYAATRCPPDLWAATGIGACYSGRYAGCVVVPIHGGDQTTWLGWVGRSLGKKGRYTYPKGMHRGEALYRGWVLQEETDVPALVVEGVFDAIHLWPDAVAVLGKASEVQMEALSLARRPVVVVLDGDAWLEGYAMALRLKLYGCRAGHVHLPPKTDPDEVPRAWLDEEVRRAV